MIHLNSMWHDAAFIIPDRLDPRIRDQVEINASINNFAPTVAKFGTPTPNHHHPLKFNSFWPSHTMWSRRSGCSVPSHYLKPYCLSVDWTTGNKLQWNTNHNKKLFWVMSPTEWWQFIPGLNTERLQAPSRKPKGSSTWKHLQCGALSNTNTPIAVSI